MDESSRLTVATGPLLETKLYVPRWRPSLVSRPSLIARLDRGIERKLTLVSAPAGFGKTTLLAEWLAATPAGKRPAAWVALDQSDNDPAHFWAYIIAALQTVQPGVGEHTRALLKSPQSPPMDSVLTALINEVTAIEGDFTLILDDFHIIDAQPIHSAVAFFLDHLPPQMHLVISTRSDPPLPLARMRGRGELTELRAADLRFTPDETAVFLTELMELDLSAADVATLETRTEGWVAGLQLAALSMQGHEDTTGFISAFAGDDRYIVDYLVEEVLQRQPECVRSFLLETAILERLSGPLCDAVTGQDGGARMLEALEHENLFVIPLDDKRHWYRYHHLFADVLTAQLMTERPDQISILYRRASAWYEQHGGTSEAIRHALAAGDFEHAADLIELAVPAMRRNRLGVTVLGWLEAIPDTLIRRRPVLSVAYAWALLAGGELEHVEARLEDAERWLEAPSDVGELCEAPSETMVVMDDEEFRRLPATIAVYRAAHAQVLGDVRATMRYAQQVLDLSPEDDHLRRGAAAALLGLAAWSSGDLGAAHQHFAAGMARVQMAGNISDAISGTITLADIQVEQGRLRDAMRTYTQALQRETERGDPPMRGTPDLYVGMSEIHREHDDLEAATQYLMRSKELVEQAGLPQNRSRWCVAMAGILEAQGDLNGALDMLLEAERMYVRVLSPDVRPLPALKARVWVAQRRLVEALGWARDHDLTVDDDLSYLREFEHITLTRVLLARYTSDREGRSMLEAMEFLKRLLIAAEEGGRTGSAIEILALLALSHQMHGDISAALVPLERALTLAEPEGYVRIFVDEGPPMALLLETAAKQGIAPNYVRQLLGAFGKADDRPPIKQGLIEPLSERELEVLRLLGSDLDGPEIARELMVSLNTLRTHTKNIYAKLGVNNRRAAVRRAEELELLSRTHARLLRPEVVQRTWAQD